MERAILDGNVFTRRKGILFVQMVIFVQLNVIAFVNAKIMHQAIVVRQVTLENVLKITHRNKEKIILFRIWS